MLHCSWYGLHWNFQRLQCSCLKPFFLKNVEICHFCRNTLTYDVFRPIILDNAPVEFFCWHFYAWRRDRILIMPAKSHLHFLHRMPSSEARSHLCLPVSTPAKSQETEPLHSSPDLTRHSRRHRDTSSYFPAKPGQRFCPSCWRAIISGRFTKTKTR